MSNTRTLNRVTLIGNIVSKPPLNITPNGVPVITFYVMTDRSWRGRDNEIRSNSTSHACVAWSRTAEICDEILEVGDLVYIEGRLETKRIVDNEGIEKEISEVVVEDMKRLVKKDADSYDASESDELPVGGDYAQEQQDR